MARKISAATRAKRAKESKERVRGVMDTIIYAFENGTVAPALAQRWLVPADVPQRKWSIRNQMLCALAGATDARGYKLWRDMGREVVKGKSIRLLRPNMVPVEEVNPNTGELEKNYVMRGFRCFAAWDVSNTTGPEETLPAYLAEHKKFVESLPLVEVAQKWGINVIVGGGNDNSSTMGWFQPRTQTIKLNVENLSTWTHELIHAADYRLGNLIHDDETWLTEAVAELGGAVLLSLIGYKDDADLGGAMEYIKKYATSADKRLGNACDLAMKRVEAAIDLIMDAAGLSVDLSGELEAEAADGSEDELVAA